MESEFTGTLPFHLLASRKFIIRITCHVLGLSRTFWKADFGGETRRQKPNPKYPI
jgi:hypothetical protein